MDNVTTAGKGWARLAERVQQLSHVLDEPLTITVTEFRRRPGHCINLVADRPAVITRRGEPVAMLMSIEMSRALEAIEQLAARQQHAPHRPGAEPKDSRARVQHDPTPGDRAHRDDEPEAPEVEPCNG